jgi:hypothetical protein
MSNPHRRTEKAIAGSPATVGTCSHGSTLNQFQMDSPGQGVIFGQPDSYLKSMRYTRLLLTVNEASGDRYL